MRVANTYIRPEQANIVVVGNKDEVAENLLRFDGDGEIEFFDSYGNAVSYDAALPEDVTANQIVEDYLDAIGGRTVIQGISNIMTSMSASIMGQEMSITSYQEGDNKFAMSFGMGGTVMQEQVYDGTKVRMSGQGQNQIVEEGDLYDEIVAGAVIVPQKKYGDDGTTLDLSGIEDVEGAKAYKVMVTSASGKKTTEYYAVDNALLIRTVSSPQEGMTVTTDYSDYKAIEGGLMMPHVTKVSGMMPIPVEMKLTEAKTNMDIPAGTFTIE
ncbi:MAG: hypothetical protein AAFR14_13265 [Bacteroidota bacterium]